MAGTIQQKINEGKLLIAELKQLDYDFERAQTLQEKFAIHNLIVTKAKERQRNEQEIQHIEQENKILEYSKIRKTKKRK